MSDNSEFEPPTPSVYPHAGTDSKLSSLLSHLVFKEHGIRLGLEVTSVITLYTILYIAVPWSALGVSVSSQGLVAWFTSCIAVTILDRLVVSRPFHIYLESCRLDFVGAYDLALKKIRSIAPHSGRLIPCPEDTYRLLRTKIFLHAGENDRAAAELELARKAGIPDEQYYCLKVCLASARTVEHTAEYTAELTTGDVINEIREKVGDTPWLTLEHGLIELQQRNMPAAKLAFRKAANARATMHYSGETTARLANAFLQVARLWTGDAEEGLDELDVAIARYRALAFHVETLRPYVATLVLERALYLATHREPLLAIADVRNALAFCAHPQHLNLATLIKEELEWRYPEIVGAAAQP